MENDQGGKKHESNLHSKSGILRMLFYVYVSHTIVSFAVHKVRKYHRKIYEEQAQRGLFFVLQGKEMLCRGIIQPEG